MLQNLAFGIIRGFGMALGFSGLAVILLFIMQFIPLTAIPIIGDIVNAVIKRANEDFVLPLIFNLSAHF